jgi:hypothetical protein
VTEVSNEILGEYQKHFMADPPLPISVCLPDGGALSSGHHTDLTTLTAQIKGALGVATGEITYDPLVFLLKTSFVFSLTGGHPYCLDDDPCWVFGYEPAIREYLLPGLLFFSFLIYPL